MKKMENVEIIELVKYRNHLLRELEEELRLDELDNNNLLHNPNRERRLIRIKSIKERIDEINTIFKETGTFKSDGFATFLAQFLTLTEGEFVKTTFIPTKDGKDGEATFYLVSSPETKELLRETIKTKSDLTKFIYSNSPEDVTKIKGKYVYPFRKNLRMKPKYAKHYRLKYAIYELMQLKYDHPDMTDEERYTIVLENTLKRNFSRNGEDEKKGSK